MSLILVDHIAPFFYKSNIDKDKDDLTSVVYWLTVCRVVHRFRKQPTRFVLENE